MEAAAAHARPRWSNLAGQRLRGFRVYGLGFLFYGTTRIGPSIFLSPDSDLAPKESVLDARVGLRVLYTLGS